MEFRINHAPVFSTLEIDLEEDEFVVAQPNSMLTMTGGIQVSARAGRRSQRSRWLSGFKNLLGGESFFTAEFAAKRNQQSISLAPESYGDILVLPLTSETGGYYLTRGSYLANVGDCELRPTYGGIKALMSKKGLFLMHAVGDGTVFCQTYGSVVERELSADEYFLVDNRFMVAFSDTIEYQLVKATKSVSHTLMSGEGFVNRYTGPGRIYYQTRGKPSVGMLGALIDAAT